jgi:hypothetical protein
MKVSKKLDENYSRVNRNKKGGKDNDSDSDDNDIK